MLNLILNELSQKCLDSLCVFINNFFIDQNREITFGNSHRNQLVANQIESNFAKRTAFECLGQKPATSTPTPKPPAA